MSKLGQQLRHFDETYSVSDAIRKEIEQMKYRVEIKAAEGGDDAKAFASELAETYARWASSAG